MQISTVAELRKFLADLPSEMPVQLHVETADMGCGCCATGEIEHSYYPLSPEIVEGTIQF